MQEEVKKHTKKIFKTVKNPTYSFGEKAKEVTIEIFIIVFAVTLSIYLHSWSVHRHEQKEVTVFYKNLRKDLVKDMEGLKRDRRAYTKLDERYETLLNITPSKLDSIERVGSEVDVPLYFFTNKINSGNYEGFKTSGKIGFIENEELKKDILAYYQQIVPYIVDVDKIFNDLTIKVMDYQAENADKTSKEKCLNPKFVMRISYLKMIGKNSIRIYDEFGLKKAAELVRKIDHELKELE